MTTTEATVPPRTASGGPGPGGARVRRQWRGPSLALVGFIAMLTFFSLEQPDTFPTRANATTVIQGLVILALIAIGATVVLALGEFDLAIPAAAALAAAVIAILTTQTSLSTGGGVVLACAIGVGVAMLVGATSGAAVAFGNASSFVITLAVGSLAVGGELFVQEQISSGTQINRFELPHGLQRLTDITFLGLRLQVFILLAVALIIFVVMTRTVFGRQAHAIGGNKTAALLAGVAVRRVTITGYVIGGMLAGIAGLILVSQQGYFTNSGPPFLLKAYAAAFFGAAVLGRKGFSIPATLLGVVFLETLANGLRLMGESLWVTSAVQGALLLTTVLVARVRS